MVVLTDIGVISSLDNRITGRRGSSLQIFPSTCSRNPAQIEFYTSDAWACKHPRP